MVPIKNLFVYALVAYTCTLSITIVSMEPRIISKQSTSSTLPLQTEIIPSTTVEGFKVVTTEPKAIEAVKTFSYNNTLYTFALINYIAQDDALTAFDIFNNYTSQSTPENKFDIRYYLPTLKHSATIKAPLLKNTTKEENEGTEIKKKGKEKIEEEEDPEDDTLNDDGLSAIIILDKNNSLSVSQFGALNPLNLAKSVLDNIQPTTRKRPTLLRPQAPLTNHQVYIIALPLSIKCYELQIQFPGDRAAVETVLAEEANAIDMKKWPSWKQWWYKFNGYKSLLQNHWYKPINWKSYIQKINALKQKTANTFWGKYGPTTKKQYGQYAGIALGVGATAYTLYRGPKQAKQDAAHLLKTLRIKK